MTDAKIYAGVPAIAQAVFGDDKRGHQDAIRRMIQRRELPHIKLDGKQVLTDAALQSWLRGRTMQCLRGLRPELLADFQNFEVPSKPKAKRGRPPKAAKLKLVATNSGGDD